MKKLALLALVALEICVCACGNNPPTSIINTQSNSSYWEAQLHGSPTGEDSGLNFVTQFSAGENGGTLSVYAFSFINQSACFPTTIIAKGLLSNLVTNSSDQVTGTMTFTVSSGTTTLTLNGNVTGTSSGSTSTTGNLSNGVVAGTWSLATQEPNCAAVTTSPPFLMCQGAATCTVP
jgi:hypothetical protein